MALIFDLDGTLTDPGVGILGSIRFALESLGAPVPEPDELREAVGPPLRDSFRRFLDTDDEAPITAAIALYRERYERQGMLENVPYPEVPPVLEALRAAGHELYVGTSKPHVFARRILEHFGLARHFEAVFGAELDGRRGDKAELLAHALERAALSPEATWMIGDRCFDVAGAKANALRSIGVLWGYGAREELEAAGADRLASRPQDLLRAIAG
jgi:phosphoglycolate phosphatase